MNKTILVVFMVLMMYIANAFRMQSQGYYPKKKCCKKNYVSNDAEIDVDDFEDGDGDDNYNCKYII